jgi:hypothetical protein
MAALCIVFLVLLLAAVTPAGVPRLGSSAARALGESLYIIGAGLFMILFPVLAISLLTLALSARDRAGEVSTIRQYDEAEARPWLIAADDEVRVK